jgi:glycosyltransferase involved in cell wall biosynthesis
MKILMITNHNPMHQSNASSNRIMSLAKGLYLNNIEVEFLFLNGYLSKVESTKYKSFGSYEGFNYKYLYSRFQRNGLMKVAFSRLFPKYFYAQSIKKVIIKNEYDYVWIGVSSLIFKICLFLFKINLPVKYFHERNEFSWITTGKMNKIHQRYLELILPKMDVFAIMTNTLIEYYKVYIGENTKILHLPMTVDFSRFKNEKNDSKLIQPYIAYCGTMNNHKDGLDILIRSFINIMHKYPDFHLYLAGPKTPEKDYNQAITYIEDHNAQHRITFMGAVPKEKIPSFLKNATILALARPHSKQAEGGFPTKLGEYLATGNPVCITSVGEIGNYLEHNKSAYIAKPGSVDSFSEILDSAISNKDAINIGNRGREVAFKNFNMDVQAKKLTKKLSETLIN